MTMELVELKEKILYLYDNYQTIDEKLMKELEKLFPLEVPNGINKEDVYLLLLYNDFNISIETAIERIKWKEEIDKQIERDLF